MHVEHHMVPAPDRGHVVSASHDCWCEPQIVWCPGPLGNLCATYVHNDYTNVPHDTIRAARQVDPDWITEVIATLGTPTIPHIKLVPPLPPNIEDDTDEVIFECEFELDDPEDPQAA
jgi:hypothetical protein